VLFSCLREPDEISSIIIPLILKFVLTSLCFAASPYDSFHSISYARKHSFTEKIRAKILRFCSAGSIHEPLTESSLPTTGGALTLEAMERETREILQQHAQKRHRGKNWTACTDPRWRALSLGEHPPSAALAAPALASEDVVNAGLAEEAIEDIVTVCASDLADVYPSTPAETPLSISIAIL
jgi:hypothetical protein